MAATPLYLDTSATPELSSPLLDRRSTAVTSSVTAATIGTLGCPLYDEGHDLVLPHHFRASTLAQVPVPPLKRMGEQRWYFAGLNANGIVQAAGDGGANALDDLYTFTPIAGLSDLASGQNVDLLFSCFSQVVFRTDTRLIVKGFRSGSIQGLPAAQLTSIIGDHSGVTGAVDGRGRLYLADVEALRNGDSPLTLPLITTDRSLRLFKVSVAGNFRVSVAFRPRPGAGTTHISEFKDLSSFRQWYKDPSNPSNHPIKHHQIPGELVQLVSNSTTFICLDRAGKVYTWGDARLNGLGRTTREPGDQPPERPGLVDSLDGIVITKVSAGGSMFAALSQDKAVYIWTGSARPGTLNALNLQADRAAGEIALVTILPDDEDHDHDDNHDHDHRNGAGAGEPYDFKDLAVGFGHVLLLTTDGKVFGAGENGNGQLATGPDRRPYHPDFVKLVDGGCTFVRAAFKSSIIRASLPES